MESGNGNDPWKTPDKGHHAIYRLDRLEFTTQCFFVALFASFLLKQSKHSNRAVTCNKIEQSRMFYYIDGL